MPPRGWTDRGRWRPPVLEGSDGSAIGVQLDGNVSRVLPPASPPPFVVCIGAGIPTFYPTLKTI